MASSPSSDPNISVAPPADQPNPAPAKDDKKKNPNKANPNSNKKKSGAVPLGPLPAFVEERAKIWDEYKKKRDEELSSMYQHPLHAIELTIFVELGDTPIKITLPDGKIVDGVAWKTTPYDIAKNISRNLAKEVIVAKV
jgi:threonyl-tRNA synthetase